MLTHTLRDLFAQNAANASEFVRLQLFGAWVIGRDLWGQRKSGRWRGNLYSATCPLML